MHTENITDAQTEFPEYPPPTASTTAPANWHGTPMEMVADAVGMRSPWRNEMDNRKAHDRKVAAQRARHRKLAKASRKRNRGRR